MKRLQWLAVAALIVGTTGCATVFTGTKEEVSFQSNPSDAEVIVDGTSRGRTPLKLSLAKKNSYTITFKKECYEQGDEVYVTRTMQMGWAILDWISFPFLYIPLGVDWLTGAWYTFDKNTVSVDLEHTCAGGSSSGEETAGSTPPKKEDGEPPKNDASEGETEEEGKCSDTELCNGEDDDCDGVIDENC